MTGEITLKKRDSNIPTRNTPRGDKRGTELLLGLKKQVRSEEN